ncbi:uncharacterized protein LOC122381660 [Amphibalanus amphitrite]|uniref:uncharacterized protein LOC122381660 n=1 Tax=Amphibalanus amphitrite TaxID=1232801 RepID=UPI001C90381F|nr:uncharacterized protein LOC122381660 [Amphibalanus amphitrite]
MAVGLKRQQKLFYAVCGLAVLGFICTVRLNSDRVPVSGWPSAGCLRILQLDSSLLGCVDHHFHTIRDPCHSDSQTAEQASGCLRRRAARLGRPARLVLIGDSRSRILQEQLKEFVHLSIGPKPEDISAADVPPGPLHDFQLFATRDMCPIRGKFCSNILTSDVLSVEFWRRPFLYTLFVQKLRAIATECRARPPACPDLVVLNGGLWYIQMRIQQLVVIENSPTAWMIKLGEHVTELRAVLRELSELVTVVWRLEEAITSDALGLGKKDMDYQKRITASHPFFYELQRQVPRLAVWSSMLPETMDVAQRVCRPVRQLNVSTDAVIEDTFDQCEDEIHAGPALRQRFISKLLDILCEVDGDREPGHCCRG